MYTVSPLAASIHDRLMPRTKPSCTRRARSTSVSLADEAAPARSRGPLPNEASARVKPSSTDVGNRAPSAAVAGVVVVVVDGFRLRVSFGPSDDDEHPARATATATAARPRLTRRRRGS